MMKPTLLERLFFNRFRRRLLLALDGPFDAEVSRRLESVDLLLTDTTDPAPARDLWERVDTTDGHILVPYR